MNHPRRRPPPRLAFDYRQARAYFVTICTHHQSYILSVVQDETRVDLTAMGEVVDRHWRTLADRYTGLRLDEHVLMPDHLHGILWLPNGEVISLIQLIGLFKAGCSRDARPLLGRERLWQRSFYDRVIRSEDELTALRRYILENPRRWISYRGRMNPAPTDNDPRRGG